MDPIKANPNMQFKAPSAGAPAQRPAATSEPKDTVTLKSRQPSPAKQPAAENTLHIQENHFLSNNNIVNAVVGGTIGGVGGAVGGFFAGAALGGPVGAVIGAVGSGVSGFVTGYVTGGVANAVINPWE